MKVNVVGYVVKRYEVVLVYVFSRVSSLVVRSTSSAATAAKCRQVATLSVAIY